MKHDGKLENSPFRGTFSINKSHPDNSSFRTITKMDHDQRTKKTQIQPTQLFLMLKLLVIDQKLTQSVLKTPMTITTLWIIPMNTLILLVHNKKT